jgi:hypothetical protein
LTCYTVKKLPIEIIVEKEAMLQEGDLDSNVTLYLEETPTILLLDIPGACIEKDSSLALEVMQQNERYKQVIILLSFFLTQGSQ